MFSRTALLVAVMALGQLASCVSAELYMLEQVVRKLEEYAAGGRLMSSITREDLVGMVEEWPQLPQETKDLAITTPQYKLLYDFGVLPTERLKDQLGDITVFIAHLRRLEAAYKRFLPAYLGQPIENYQIGTMKTRHFDRLFDKLLANAPVELKDFQLAKDEHDAWIQRYKEIVIHEDVYTNQEEMRNILNYHNSELAKPLFDFVLPQLGPNSDPNALKQLYYVKLYEIHKIRFVNSQPVRDP